MQGYNGELKIHLRNTRLEKRKEDFIMKEKVVSTEEVVQVVEKKIYIAYDGTEFTSVTECEEYECILA